MFYVWQRFLAAFVSYHHYHQATKGSIPLTNRFRLVAAIAENVGLMILSAVSSKDHLIVHELSFGVFAISAFIVMLLTNILIRQWIKVAERGGYEPDPRCTLATARRALSWRTRSSMISTISLILAFYFFTTSQKGYSHCRTNYWYSYFALCEWSYVVIGILFHINGEQIELWYVDWSFLYSLGGGRDGMGEGKGDSSMVVDGGRAPLRRSTTAAATAAAAASSSCLSRTRAISSLLRLSSNSWSAMEEKGVDVLERGREVDDAASSCVLGAPATCRKIGI